MNKEKLLCKNHFEDYAIASFIKNNSDKGKCYYCGDSKVKSVINIDQLSVFIEEALLIYYDDAANWLPYESGEGGYQLSETYNTYELLFHELELEVNDNELRSDLASLLPDNAWCLKDPMGDTMSDELYYNWEEFKQVVKYKIRFSFFVIDKVKYNGISINISSILKRIIQLIKEYKLIEPLTTDRILYRCRQYEDTSKIINSKSICSPPKENVTFSNRMSPAGISMFYAAFEMSTAFKETVDTKNLTKPYFSIGSFSPKNELHVINLSNLPKIPSLFDLKKRKHYYPLIFLHRFVHDLSQPIKRDGREHIDYVPTQIITEYIRYFFSKSPNLKVGGIIYPSAKTTKETACVLFLDHDESVEALQFNKFHIENRLVKDRGVHLSS